MSILTVVLLCIFLFLLVMVVLRLTIKNDVEPVTLSEMAGDRRSGEHGRPLNYEAGYQEVLNLGDVLLEKDELVLAACGQRGEVENVLLATSKRIFFFTRRFGASRYYSETFEYSKIHPLSLASAVIG
jgi:hypothetical protein